VRVGVRTRGVGGVATEKKKVVRMGVQKIQQLKLRWGWGWVASGI